MAKKKNSNKEQIPQPTPDVEMKQLIEHDAFDLLAATDFVVRQMRARIRTLEQIVEFQSEAIVEYRGAVSHKKVSRYVDILLNRAQALAKTIGVVL